MDVVFAITYIMIPTEPGSTPETKGTRQELTGWGCGVRMALTA